MPLILPSNSISALGYDVANSLRFNSGSSDYLNRTPSSAGNRKTFTISFWIKRSDISSTQDIINAYSDSNNFGALYFDVSDVLVAKLKISSVVNTSIITNRVFRDTSAWYHIVWKVDTTQSTESERSKIYINGVEETSFSSATYLSQNTDTAFNNTVGHTIFGLISGGAYFGGYMSEVVMIDGTALDPTSFGEFDADTGIWKPIDVSGLTFGTNGFYLDFESSGSLGNDVSGNGNNFTVNNLTSIDQTTDTPTNNYATMNPLVFRTTSGTKYSPTFSEGNNYLVSTNDSSYEISAGTFMLSSGKWYFEWKANGVGDTSADFSNCVGIKPADGSFDGTSAYAGTNRVYSASGKKCDGTGTTSAYGDTWTTNDILGCYIDLDNYKIYFAKNGVMQNSADVSAGTGFAFNDLNAHDSWIVYTSLGRFSVGSQSANYFNFGNPPFSISSSNSDANGYGSFEYNPTEDGVNFYALNTKNLSEFG